MLAKDLNYLYLIKSDELQVSFSSKLSSLGSIDAIFSLLSPCHGNQSPHKADRKTFKFLTVTNSLFPFNISQTFAHILISSLLSSFFETVPLLKPSGLLDEPSVASLTNPNPSMIPENLSKSNNMGSRSTTYNNRSASLTARRKNKSYLLNTSLKLDFAAQIIMSLQKLKQLKVR